MLKMKNCLNKTLLIFPFLFMSAGMAQDDVASPKEPPCIVAGPYLQNPTETSMTVMWLTDKNCTAWVEHGPSESLGMKAQSAEHGLVDANTRIHKVVISGLKPGCKTYYRVCSTEILDFQPYKVVFGKTVSSEVFSFETLSLEKKTFSFIVFNDIHEKIGLFKKLHAQVKDKSFDLVFLNGDILNHLESEQQIIDHLLEPCTELFATTIPFVYVRGNHEARGRFARRLPDYLANPNDRFFFAFSHGPARFIIFDTGEDKEDSHWAYSGLTDFDAYRSMEQAWLEEEIQSKPFEDARFQISLTHIPFFGNSDWHGPLDSKAKFLPLLNRGKVDMHISGHTHRHTVKDVEVDKHTYPVVIGGAPKEGKAVVIRVEVTEKRLNMSMIRDDGVCVWALVTPAGP